MTGGLVTLESDETELLRTLDRIFEGWAGEAGARSMIMPPLLPVTDLAGLDFYDNFPHQALLVSPLNLDKLAEERSTLTTFQTEQLEPAALALPSAACFAVYLHHRGQVVPDGTIITVLGRCFRKEYQYDGLRRLLGFHMREIVALGSQSFVEAHLTTFSARIAKFVAALDLTYSLQVATDPFYDQGGPRALLQRLAPVKHEFVVDDLAIASLNVHRNFFGERCDITLSDTGTPIFTSCVAFGLERWLSVLGQRHGDWTVALEKVAKAGVALEGITL